MQCMSCICIVDRVCYSHFSFTNVTWAELDFSNFSKLCYLRTGARKLLINNSYDCATKVSLFSI